ncbi:MAG TPA: iron-containing alcohol dehydrogenase [Roseateles sp.]|uniref:iron-containing alcohol dehydrogenase n=1 Tax=Roseateles sp. TaxID=1971397 RepID=UPI002ED9898D
MAQILHVTRIEFEFGASRLLPAECERAGMRRPLVVTDAGVRAAGVLDRALAAFSEPPAVFDRTPPNPNEAAVRLAVEQLREQGCDGLIAIGGGSSIDLAKGVAIAATHEGPLKRWATIEGGAVDISAKVLPVIAVPTTAGTGSEVARGAILIVDDGRKLGFHNWALLPKAAICDPELTLALPPALTAATGMDAIAHCIETFLAPAFNPPADGIALEGLRRGWQSIERATHDGQDRDARLDMMCASVHGALAFQKGLGAVHSLSHALGGLEPRLHHGTLNAVFLPAVIRFNAEADSVRREDRVARLAQAMGLAGRDAEAVASAIAALNARLGLPGGLAAMGVAPGLDERIVERALLDHCHKTNPRIASADDYRTLLAASR